LSDDDDDRAVLIDINSSSDDNKQLLASNCVLFVILEGIKLFCLPLLLSLMANGLNDDAVQV